MTVKTQGGKVITKGGKVSCGCCGECCMYPAATLVAGIYGYQDLPDAIDIDGIEYTKLDPPQSVSGFTRYYININEEYLGILDGEGEDSLWTYEGGGGPCLISGFNGEGGEREDQFADAYTITGGQLGPIQVIRISLCLWIGLDSCGNEGSLAYIEDPFQGKLWFADVPNYLEPCERFDVRQGEKIGLQNSPVGNYGNPPYIETVLTVT